MSDYDKELINRRVIEVCDYYLPGEGRREGQKRRIWECPECGKDSFSANDENGYAGCFSSCEMPRATDAVAIIARFEGLELSKADFVACLKKGYEILAIPEPDDERGSQARSTGPRSVNPTPEQADPSSTAGSGESEGSQEPEPQADPEQQSPATEAVSEADSDTAKPAFCEQAQGATATSTLRSTATDTGKSQPEETAPWQSEQQRELVDRVYRAFLELCPLVQRDREFWHSRGVTDETIEKGGFGSIWREHCQKVLAKLEERFGQEALTSVPGFYISPYGKLHTNLYDDYTLIPYYDREGYITTVEGRVPGEPAEGKPKYMAPVNAENHLYVFPRYAPEQVIAFCEGLIGAVVAAQEGIPVASIKGCRCYRTSTPKGERDLPLPELRVVDFERRRRLYIPDLDVKAETRAEVEGLAPEAARWLIEEQNGTALLARLPDGYKDLDEWLLSVDEVERVPMFAGLMPRAVNPEQWENGQAPGSGPDDPQPEKDGSAKKTATTEIRQSVIGDSEAQTDEEESDPGDSEEAEQQDEAPRVKVRQPRPRAHTPIPWTNFGEFVVALFYALIVGVGCLSVLVYVAAEWRLTSFVAAVPVWISVVASAVAAALVFVLVCWRLYLRRWRALSNHLAGNSQ